MSCTQVLSGIQVDCEPSMGGLKVVYIANSSDVTDFTAGKVTLKELVESGRYDII